MLTPLTRATFEAIIPIAATGAQYRYYWGNPSDFLRRLLFSFAAVVVVQVLRYFIGESFQPFSLILSLIAILYWLWSPILFACRRNLEYRKYKYSGFWTGEVLDLFVTEELIGTQEKVDKQGELIVVENHERRLNLELGDESGYFTSIQVPLKKAYRMMRQGDAVEMIVMSTKADLSRIFQISDLYVPDYELWVSDYPCVQRSAFTEVSQRLVDQDKTYRDQAYRDRNKDRDY